MSAIGEQYVRWARESDMWIGREREIVPERGIARHRAIVPGRAPTMKATKEGA
ncbi:MAG: hypothetical protein CHACPFDD_02382 [Phycisphaerae bacterium]|nr:hypothetical protein [Phycisphaerae bacterium]